MFIQTILIFSVLLDVLATLDHRLETPTAMKLGNLDLQVIVECFKVLHGSRPARVVQTLHLVLINVRHDLTLQHLSQNLLLASVGEGIPVRVHHASVKSDKQTGVLLVYVQLEMTTKPEDARLPLLV